MKDSANPPDSVEPGARRPPHDQRQSERVFEAWTRPEHLLAWGGALVPSGAPEPTSTCASAGGIASRNELPDGAHVTIEGEFRTVAEPHTLVYTWEVSPGSDGPSLVTVRFESRGRATEVVVVHERIATPTWARFARERLGRLPRRPRRALAGLRPPAVLC